MNKYKMSKKQIAARLVLLLLILSMIPIVIISFYNVPYFDDFNHGYLTHSVVNNGFDLIAFLQAALQQVKDVYFSWQGCYSGIFLSAIHPGVFSENLYGLGSLLIFTIHIFSIMYFSNIVIKKIFKLNYYWIIIGGLMAIMQIQYLPSVQEGFFWWSGAVMHTLMFDLMIVTIALILKQLILKNKTFLNIFIVFSLLFICGGGAYEIALFIPVLLLAIIICYFIFRKINNKKIDDYRVSLLFIYFFLSLICLFINILAPGNAYRIESSGIHVNPILAILESFIYSAIHLAEYFSIRLIIIILLTFYCIFPKIKNLNFKFIDIKIFTLGLWCLYSVLFTPAIYGENYVASARYLNVLYFASYWFILVEFLYFCWYYRESIILNKIHDILVLFISQLKISTFILAIIFTTAASVMELRYTDATSMSAFLDFILGNANNYKLQNESNFIELYSDDKVVEINGEESIVRVFPQNGSYDKAIIEAMKKYYDKDEITVK